MFIDRGEVYFPQTGFKRRKYFFNGSAGQSTQFSAVAKIRWVQKESGDELTLKNFEAIRLMSQAILLERAEKWQESVAAQGLARNVLERELTEYLAGVKHVPSVEMSGYGFGDLGAPL